MTQLTKSRKCSTFGICAFIDHVSSRSVVLKLFIHVLLFKCLLYPFLPILSEVWPEGDVFGSAEVEPEEELDLLKQILFAELPSKLIFK